MIVTLQLTKIQEYVYMDTSFIYVEYQLLGEAKE